MYLQIHEEAREAHVSEEVREETKWGKNNIRIEEEEGEGNEGVTIVTS